ncbi:MAG: hypothetical protein AB7E47_10710 [Desulfovibrionaceae bacterium]
MKLTPVVALSLALQRTFPHVFRQVHLLKTKHDQGESPRLAWPDWCVFPIGLSFDLLRGSYGYERNGVEPFLLSALAGWETERRIVRLDPAALPRTDGLPSVNGVPVTALSSQTWRCLYVAYEGDAEETHGALGSFIFCNYNGPGEDDLVFLLHLDPYRVEPVTFPLQPRGKTLGGLAVDLERALRAGCPTAARAEDGLFDTLMALCRVNLGFLDTICRAPHCAAQTLRPQ